MLLKSTAEFQRVIQSSQLFHFRCCILRYYYHYIKRFRCRLGVIQTINPFAIDGSGSNHSIKQLVLFWLFFSSLLLLCMTWPFFFFFYYLFQLVFRSHAASRCHWFAHGRERRRGFPRSRQHEHHGRFRALRQVNSVVFISGI